MERRQRRGKSSSDMALSNLSLSSLDPELRLGIYLLLAVHIGALVRNESGGEAIAYICAMLTSLIRSRSAGVLVLCACPSETT